MTWDRSIVLAAMVAMLAYIIAALIWPSLVPAQGRCGPLNDMVEQITGKPFKEAQAGIGRLGAGVLMLFVNPETRTWTIFSTQPGGLTCFVAAGDDWERIAFPLPGEPL